MGLLDPSTSDGRIIFFLPWQKHTLAGKEEDLIHINQPFTLVFFFFLIFGILTLGVLVIVPFFPPGTTDSPCDLTDSPAPTEKEIQFILNEVKNYLHPDVEGKCVKTSRLNFRYLSHGSHVT